MTLPELSRDEIARYARHIILDEIGLEGQQRLKAASILCVGTGGLGAPVLMYLAAAGIGRLGVCDFDVVDESNLHRQIIHDTSAVGRPKVESARARLVEINPHVEVTIHDRALTRGNALEIIGGYDLVADGTDNFATRYLVNDACVILGKPNAYASIFKFEGQASVFNYQGGPNYRDLFPEPPPPGSVPSCAEGGVLGVLPGVMGCIQATEAIKIALGRDDTLSGRLLLYDALAMRFRELRLRKNPELAPITELADYEALCGELQGGAVQPTADAAAPFQTITAKEARQRLDQDWRPYVLDVRKPHEADISRLEFTDRLQPHEKLAAIAAELPRDRDILVHCKMGVRSAKACTALVEAGFEPGRIYNLAGGINAWAKDVDPSLTRY